MELAGREHMTDTTKCPVCYGRGYIPCDCWPADCICGYGDETCEYCDGYGNLDHTDGEFDDYGAPDQRTSSHQDGWNLIAWRAM